MTGEEFMELYTGCPELRQHIVDQAKRHSSIVAMQEDFCQDAWLRISLCEAGCCVEYYKREAYNAVQNAYKREKLQRHDDYEYTELMDRAIYNAWQMGYFKRW